MIPIQRKLAALCQEYAVRILFAFGSRAREALDVLEGRRQALAPSSSDLDVGIRVEAPRALTAREKAALAVALEELFGAPRVDVVVLGEADPFLAANIIRGERLYCDDSYAADEYELYVLRRAGDLAPLEQERLSLLEGR